ncbi:peptide chain release factor H [Roseibium sp. MMSF_3412]|uniref:peptide chain release factor H n=1 Tax=Roseibium sp. MMSF_3412 TaxID=3046712 RepID=UPI00273D67F8|nr:peptide chain release factor H [Roseibium sp. MMSF_3412]
MTASLRKHLLVTSGDGPRECQRAVAHVLRRMKAEADQAELRFAAEVAIRTRGKDPSSALVTVIGSGAAQFAENWLGTIKWVSKSPFRPHHKRQNWFIGVFEVEWSDAPEFELDTGSLRIETFRSGGPGGQHQNTTDSGVRITHLPSGLAAASTDERSQHRNRQVALDRLRMLFVLRQEGSRANDRSAQNRLHRRLERGNPLRVFKGDGFAEVPRRMGNLARIQIMRRKHG